MNGQIQSASQPGTNNGQKQHSPVEMDNLEPLVGWISSAFVGWSQRSEDMILLKVTLLIACLFVVPSCVEEKRAKSERDESQWFVRREGGKQHSGKESPKFWSDLQSTQL